MSESIGSTGTEMSKERMGEIALAYLKAKIRKDSISMDPEKIRREIGNIAKDTGIKPDEALSFTSILLAEAFDAVLQGLSKEKKGPGF